MRGPGTDTSMIAAAVTKEMRETKITVRMMLASQSMTKNAVTTLPKMLPTVEIAAIDPAVDPLSVVRGATSRTAIGDTEAKKNVGRANSTLVARKAWTAKSSPDAAMRGEIRASSHGTTSSVAAALMNAATSVMVRG